MEISSLQLKAFYQLAQDLSFTKSAKHLHITQSALSTRISNLEKDLEARLFIREKSNIRLTEAGVHLLQYCERSTRLESEALSYFKSDHGDNTLRGTIRIGGYSSVLRSAVLPALAPLLVEHKHLGLELVTREFEDLLKLMQTSKVDFLISPKKIDTGVLQSKCMGHESYVLAELKSGLSPDIFLDHDSSDETTRRYFNRFQKGNEEIQRRYLDDVYGLINGVECGVGKAILPLHLIQDNRDILVPYPNKKLCIPIYLVTYKIGIMTRVESIIEHLIDKYFQNNFNK